MKTSALVLIILLLVSCQKSEKILYHEYNETASDFDISKWNLSDTIGYRNIIKETVDDSGRVKQLEFFENGNYAKTLCYLANRVTYDYKKNLIIERFFWGKNPVYANDCEMNHKIIYHLDKKNYIIKIETFSIYDTISLNPAEIIQLKKIVPQYSTVYTSLGQFYIDYYAYSFAKMNGIFPASKNFELTKESYFGGQTKTKSIENGLNKLHNRPKDKDSKN